MRAYLRNLGLVVAILASLAIPRASALDRVQWLYGLQPPNSWANQQERFLRIGFGQLIFDLLGNQNGTYAHIAITPQTGLFVQVGPSVANGVGSVYQYLAEEGGSAFGGYPSGLGLTALALDPTTVFIQGTTLSNSAPIGPLTGAAGGGNSISYLVEAKISTLDQTSQTQNIITQPGNVVTPVTVNRDRADTIIYQTKASAQGNPPTNPTVDAGWVAIGYVIVPNGTVTITGGMITPSAPLSGAVQLSPPAQQTGAINVSGSTTTSTLLQTSAAQFAKRVALVAGTTTFTFPTAYTSIPVCTASPEGSTANILKAAPTTANVVVTSSAGGDTQFVDIICVGNPS